MSTTRSATNAAQSSTSTATQATKTKSKARNQKVQEPRLEESLASFAHFLQAIITLERSSKLVSAFMHNPIALTEGIVTFLPWLTALTSGQFEQASSRKNKTKKAPPEAQSTIERIREQRSNLEKGKTTLSELEQAGREEAKTIASELGMSISLKPETSERDQQFKSAIESLSTKISSSTSQLIQVQGLGNTEQEALIKRDLGHSKIAKEIFTKAQTQGYSIEDTRKIAQQVDQRLREIDSAEDQVARIQGFGTLTKRQRVREFFSPTMRSVKPSGTEASQRAAQNTAKADLQTLVAEHKFLEDLI